MTTMLPLSAVMADMNDNLFNSHSTGSCILNSGAEQVNKSEFDAKMFDRPDICALNNGKNVNTSPQRNIARRPMPLISKKDFVEQWLLEHSDVACNEMRSDNGSLSLVESVSTKSKRVLRSPFRDFNEIKRFKNTPDKSINSMKCLMDVGSPTRSKENRAVNKSNGKVEKICRYMTAEHTKKTFKKSLSANFGRFSSNDCSVDIKFQAYKDIISGSPKKITKSSVIRSSKQVLDTTAHSFKSCRIAPYESPIRQIASDIECQSSDITEVESVAPSSPLFDSIEDCIDCESPKKSDIQSLPSSPQVVKVCIDSGSSDITDPGHDPIVDTDRDKIISQDIDDSDANLSISLNNSECDAVPVCLAERQVISPVHSNDSDETYFSHDDSLNRTIIELDNDILPSQTISQDYVSLQNSDVKSDSIDQEISSGNSLSVPSSKLENSDGYPIIAATAIKKRKKPKKGSLVGRLQALIVGQTSFLRIWRHQMSQKHLEKNNKQFIFLKIQNCTSIYNRQYLVGSVISDTHKLLDKVVGADRSTGKNDLHKPTAVKTITILTAPEIVGTINIKENSAMEIYPPWEVIDAEKMILSVLYFRMTTNNHSLISEENSNDKTVELIEKFDCPCLTACQLVDSCQTKFTNVKPNLMHYLFND